MLLILSRKHNTLVVTLCSIFQPLQGLVTCNNKEVYLELFGKAAAGPLFHIYALGPFICTTLKHTCIIQMERQFMGDMETFVLDRANHPISFPLKRTLADMQRFVLYVLSKTNHVCLQNNYYDIFMYICVFILYEIIIYIYLIRCYYFHLITLS